MLTVNVMKYKLSVKRGGRYIYKRCVNVTTPYQFVLHRSGLAAKKGKCRTFYGQVKEYSAIAVVSIGKQNAGYNELEEVDEGRENVRTAVSTGVKQLHEVGIKSIDVDPCGDPEGWTIYILMRTIPITIMRRL